METDINFDYSQVYKIRSIKINHTNPLYYENNIQERFSDNNNNNNNIFIYLSNKCFFCLCFLPIIFLIYYLLINFHLFKDQN